MYLETKPTLIALAGESDLRVTFPALVKLIDNGKTAVTEKH